MSAGRVPDFIRRYAVLIAFFSVSNAPVTTAAPAQPMVAAGPVLPDARS